MNEVFSKDLGIVTAYGYALSKGYTGTEEQFATLMASYATIGQQAVDAALAAEGYAVGTHNGTPVPSTDPAYENNAKYFAEQIEAESESFARIDGSYDSMTVGNAEQLISSQGITEQTPYNFRISGGSADIGNRKTMQIVGGSLAWNQTFYPRTSQTALGLTTTINSDLSITVSGKVTANGNFGLSVNDAEHPNPYTSGHVYYLGGMAKNISYITLNRYIGTRITDTGNGAIAKATANGLGSDGIRLTIAASAIGYEYNFTIRPQFIDLTLLFGSAIADYIYSLETANTGDGVAYFRKLFPKPYYAYCASSLESVNVSAAEMVGFNQFDYSAGAAKLLGGQQYQITGAYTTLAYVDLGGNSETIMPDANGLFTPTNNGTLTITGGNSTTTCVHLVWSGTRNGEYEPYEKRTYPLDSSLTLRGVPKLNASNELYYDGDTYAADGTVTRRYGIVNLGTLSWNINTSNTPYVFYAQVNGMSANRNLKCAMFITVEDEIVDSTVMRSKGNMTIGRGNPSQNNNVYIRDDSYSDKDTFATAMSGVYLVYELATPTTETADAFQSPMVVNDWGTEALVDYAEAQGTRDVAIPCGNVSFYQANLVDKLNHLPNLASGDGNYIISQSGTQMTLVPLITPTELPVAPTTDGTYTLTVTVADGQATYSWT